MPQDVTYLDICNYMPQRPMSGSPSGTALTLHLRSTSVSSSLASPGDSGVALDSDMDAANETDASSYKEVDKTLFAHLRLFICRQRGPMYFELFNNVTEVGGLMNV